MRNNKGKGTFAGAVERRLDKSNKGESPSNNEVKGPGQWTPETWESSGKTGKRPEHSFENNSLEKALGGGKGRGRGRGRGRGNSFGGSSGPGQSALNFMPNGVARGKVSKPMKPGKVALPAVARRLNKGM